MPTINGGRATPWTDLVRRVVHLGADRAAPSEVKYLLLANTLVAVLIAICLLFYWPLSFVLGNRFTQVEIPAMSGALCLAFWLNHRGNIGLAVAWIEFLSIAAAAVIVFVEGPGIQYLLLMYCILPFLLIPPGREWAMLALVVVGMGAFVTLTVMSGAPSITRSPAEPLPTLAVLSGLGGMLAAAGYYSRRVTLRAEALLHEEREKSERLLLNILPESIAARLKDDARVIADSLAQATVLFADVVGFTVLSGKVPPEQVVGMLNEVFHEFDDLAEKHGLEKIKTIGDAYMVAGGLPEPRGDHADAVAEMALGMIEALGKLKTPTGDPLDLRIGIHTGPVVAGVIGKKKFTYDLWGDTVNTASRMESHGAPGRIHVTRAVYEKLKGRFEFEDRGPVSVKGKGEMVTYFLTGRRAVA